MIFVPDFKPRVVRARWWLDEIKMMRCLVPGCQAIYSDPHHLCRLRDRDDFACPICRLHHTCDPKALHVIGELAFMILHNFNPYETLLKRLLPQFEAMSRMRGHDENDQDLDRRAEGDAG